MHRFSAGSVRSSLGGIDHVPGCPAVPDDSRAVRDSLSRQESEAAAEPFAAGRARDCTGSRLIAITARQSVQTLPAKPRTSSPMGRSMVELGLISTALHLFADKYCRQHRWRTGWACSGWLDRHGTAPPPAWKRSP